ncbi:hypothetical protein ACE6H2_001527 [Prunus campanulata]
MDIVSKTTDSPSASSQIVTIQSDNAPFPTGITLTETNYALWSQTQTPSSRPEIKCTYCGGSKHTRARCYELIGYPDWWDHSKAPRKNKSTSLHTSSVTDPASAPASASVATSGTQGHSQQQDDWLWY